MENTYEKLAAAKAMAIQIAEAGDGTVREEDITNNLRYRPEETAFMGLTDSLEDDGYIVERGQHHYSYGGLFKIVGKSTLPPAVEPPAIDLSLPAEERLLQYLLSGGSYGVELLNNYASLANLYTRAECEPAMAALRNYGYVIDVVKRYGGWRYRIVGMPSVAAGAAQ